MKTVYAFMNSYTSGKSGGDMAFIEIFKRIRNIHLVVITSNLGKKLCQENKLKADYLLTSSEKKINNILNTYSQRIIKGSFLQIKPKTGDCFYATSDALPDTLPIFFLKKKFTKIRWIQKIYHFIPQNRRLSSYSQKISFYLIKKFADRIIVTNEKTKNDLVKFGFSKKKLSINPLGIDLTYFKMIKPNKTVYDGIFLGRLHPSKGIFTLIKIWKMVVTKFPKVKLAIIGQGEQKILNRLSKRIWENNLGKNIVILGYLDNDQTFSLVKSAKVFVFPSLEEGFGLSVLESLVCGTSVIAYDLPCYNQNIKKQINLVPKNSVKLFAQAVIAKLSTRKMKLETNFLYKFNWVETTKNEEKLIN